MNYLHRQCYDKCIQLGILNGDGKPRPYSRSISTGYMDLCVEPLELFDGVMFGDDQAFSMAHYFEQNGDLCCDPSMELVVVPRQKIVVPYTFQQSIPPVYDRVLDAEGKVVNKKLSSLTKFLVLWLNNLVSQGHGSIWQEGECLELIHY